jgi:hypothetical protein
MDLDERRFIMNKIEELRLPRTQGIHLTNSNLKSMFNRHFFGYDSDFNRIILQLVNDRTVELRPAAEGGYMIYPYGLAPPRRVSSPESCDMLETHHALLGKDSDHISTDVMEKLLGRGCSSLKDVRYPISRTNDNILLEKHKKFMGRVKKYGVTSDVDDEYWDRKKKRVKPKSKRKLVKKCRCK